VYRVSLFVLFTLAALIFALGVILFCAKSLAIVGGAYFAPSSGGLAAGIIIAGLAAGLIHRAIERGD